MPTYTGPHYPSSFIDGVPPTPWAVDNIGTFREVKDTVIGSPISGGVGYASAPTVGFVGGNGSGAAGTAVLTTETLTSITVTNGGSGYVTAPAVTFTGGGGSAAAATAVLTNGVVTSFTVTAPGSGYTGVPTVVIATAGHTNAAATAIINSTTGQVTGITVTNPGTGYIVEPVVTFSGGGGVGAAAVAFIDNNTVESVICYTQEYPTNIAVGGTDPKNLTDLYTDFLDVLGETAALITTAQTDLATLVNSGATYYDANAKDYVLNMDAQKFYIIMEKLMDVNFQLNRLNANVNLVNNNPLESGSSVEGVTGGSLGVSRYPSGQNRGY